MGLKLEGFLNLKKEKKINFKNYFLFSRLVTALDDEPGSSRCVVEMHLKKVSFYVYSQ